MSDLLVLLGVQQAPICQTLREKLDQGICPTLSKTELGQADAMFAALKACCVQNSDAPAAQWAKDLRAELPPGGAPRTEVLTALNWLEWAVRLAVVRSVHQKRSMLAALETLAGAVDWLRRSYFAPRAAEAAADQPVPEDFAAFAEGTSALICFASIQGRPFYVNRAGRQMLGLAENAPLDPASLHRFYTDNSWRELRDVAVPAVKERGVWEGRSQLHNLETDQTLEVQTTVCLMRRVQAGKPAALAIVHRDDSRSARLEEELAEVRARKNAILESSLDPIITINHEGVITEFNRAAEQTFGYQRDDVLGTKPSEVLFPPSKSEGQQNRIDRYLDVGEGSMLGRRTEVTAVRRSGETFPAEMAMTISEERGAPVMTFFVRDISLRKKAEQQQERYAAELVRSNRELEQFAYVASHDLQEPLRKIRTFGDRLEMKCGEALDETGRHCVARMQDAAARMQRLIDGLLTLSRVTTRGQQFEPVDLEAVAREVIADLEVQIERVEGRVELGRLPTIQADPLQMQQLFQNLIGNALKFRRIEEPPIVKVHGRFMQSREERRAGAPASAEKCLIRVEDNGIGFEDKYSERIFDVFQRLHPRDVYEGTGVGLAICRKIVERHGGTIRVTSTPGKGTAFEVVLPVMHHDQPD
ncbi:MAG: PAS domain S-box protein [Thermoguttaceae bacterium]|jgi:two-component system sensor kinase FixL|nr:PAS domain S-box protein [Thermoguttaceae bacterium]